MGSFSLSGGVEVFGFISPSNTSDQYPVIDPLYGIDGLRNVNLLSDLDSIPLLRRRAGMVVGVSGGTIYYQLNPPPWNLTFSDWGIFSPGTFTGGTVTGDTIFTNGLTATTFSASTYLGLPSDVYVSGYSYSNNTFTIERSFGNPNLSAIINDVTGLTINGDLNVTGTTYTDSISANTYQNLPLDVFVTGGTYSAGTATFANNSGGTFNVNGFLKYFISPTTPTGTTDGDRWFNTNDGRELVYVSDQDGSQWVVPNGTSSLFGSLSATTISATTYQNLPIDPDTYVTGFSYNNNTFTIEDNSGSTFNATFNYITGLTINGDLIVTGSTDLDIVSASTINITSIPNTNTSDTSVLVRNSTTGEVEVRLITSLISTNNTIYVALTGSTGVDFNTIKQAVDSVTGATSANTYTVKVYGGVYYEDPFTIPSWVAVVGDSSLSTVIEAKDSQQTLINLSDQSAIFDCQVQGCTGTNVSAIVYSSSTTPQSLAISYVENVRFGSNYTHAKVVAYGGANIIMQCSNVKYGGQPFTIGFYATNSGSGIGRMQLRNVTSTNGGITTTPGLIFAKADAQSCGFIVNGCLLTKAAGVASGTGFYVENGGFLRLTAVNFQRWSVGIDVPQIGSAPSIDAIALNFENNTIDVNIVHSGAIGKIQGTDNFLKTIINQNAPIYEVNQDPKEIVVAKKDGDFSSVKSAVDYLIASGNTSLTNRYVISVGPGVFIEDEIDLTQTPYVSIVGSSIQTTQILPNTNTQHIIKIGINNEISFLTLSGAPLGYAAIYCYDIGDFAQVHKLSFYDCDICVWVESNTQDTKFYGEYIDYNGEYEYGTKVIGNNGYLALANMENYFNFPIGVNITYCNYVTGSGATLNIFVGDNVSNGVSGTTAYYIQDGASLNASTITIDGCTYGLRNPNIGDPIRFDIDNASFVNGEWDLYVERIGTFGTLGGSSSHQKIFTVSDDVYWLFLDIDDGELYITRKASVTFTDGSHTDFTTLIFEGSSMGLLSGGTLTTISATTVQADSGFGYVEKSDNSGIVRRINWSATQITLSSNTDNYIFINENSNLGTSGTRPNSDYNIILGRVVTNSTDVEFIDLTPFDAEHTSNKYNNLFSNAVGPIYNTGSIVTEGVTTFTLDISSGDYYFSTSQINPIGGTGVTFTQYYRNGTGSTWVTSAASIVNNTQYDNNGTLTALTTSYYTKHTLYVVGDGAYENYFLVLGQNEYLSLIQTENALLPTPPTYFTDSVTPIANIYIQEGTTGITQIEDIRPIIGFRAGGVNSSSVHGNLLGLTADDHIQYLLVSGSRAMSGNLDMGLNNITNVGTVDSVMVSSHATRHQFGGLDQVGTTTPTANAIPYADVSGTLDSWISTASTSNYGKVQISDSSSSVVVSDSDLRFLNSFTGGTYSNGTLSLTNNSGSTYTITGLTTPFTGGTVIGATNFTNGLTANTISATTYQNLPISSDIYVTGFSYSNNTFTISQNSGSPLASLINTMTGLTINGDLSTTGYTVVGGQFVSLGGTSVTSPTYRTSLGGSNLSPRGTFGIESVGASNHRYSFDPVNQNGLVFTVANNGSVYIARAAISILASGGIGSEIGTMIFNTLNGSDYSERMRINNLGNVGIGNSSPSEKLDVLGKTKTTNIQITSGATNEYVLTSDVSGNGTWKQIPSFTGGTVTGTTNFTNGLTVTTISATTYQNLPIDITITGGTYSNNTFTYTNNTGETFNVLFNSVTGLTSSGTIQSNTISATTYQNLPTDIRVTGGTYSNGTTTFTNNTGGTFNVTGFVTGDTFATGYSYSNNTFTINQNNGQPNLTATIDNVTGLTSTGTISSSIISATTYLGFANAIYPVGTIQALLQSNDFTTNTGTMQINRLVGYYITIQKNISIDTLYVRAGTTNAASRITYGIYNLNSVGYPDAKLFNSTEFTLAVGTSQTQVVSLTLSAGTYFVAANMNSNSGGMIGFTRFVVANTAIGTTDVSASFVPRGYDVARVYSTTLPTTFPAGATSSGTASFNGLWFRIA